MVSTFEFVYNGQYFKRFFKLPITLFNDIGCEVERHDKFFKQKTDAAGRIGLTSLQKIASAVRQLTSGVSRIEHDNKYRMAATTGLEAMKRFAMLSMNSMPKVHFDIRQDVT